jgi:putative flippase GtrA
LLSTMGGVAFNYFTTRQLVFAWRDGGRLFRFALIYVVIYVLNAAALRSFEAAMPTLLAQAILLPFFVVLAFLCNRHFVFSSPRKSPS